MQVGLVQAGWRRGAGMTVSPSSGLLPWLRWVALFFGLAVLAVSLPVVTSVSTGPWPAALAVVAAAALGAWLIRTYRQGRADLLGDALAAGALFVLGTGLGSPTRALGIFSASLVFRALYATERDAWGAALLQAGAYSAAMLAVMDPTRPISLGEAVLPVVLLLLAVPVLHAVVQALDSHERTAVHTQTQATASAALLAATDVTAIGEAARRGARELLEGHVAGAPVAAFLHDQQFMPVTDDRRQPRPLPLAALGEQLQAHLETGHAILTRQLALRNGALVRRADLDGPQVLLAPIAHRGRLHGLIAVEHANDGGSCTCVPPLEALTAQVALSLENTRLHEVLTRSETRYRSLVQHSSDVIAVVDAQGAIDYVSPSVARMLGYAPAGLTSSQFDLLVHTDDHDAWDAFFARLVGSGQRATTEVRLRHRSGVWRNTEIAAANLNDEPSIGGMVLNIRDVSAQKVLEDRLTHRANHDPLTGLPNRSLFLERVRHALARGAHADSVAVLFIDLDGFKSINDSFGHAAGDELLLVVAARMEGCLGEHDTAARLAGDEFAILVEDLHGTADGERFGDRVLRALAEPCSVGTQNVKVRASIGLAMGGGRLDDAEDLVHRADLAMYTAKGEGKNRLAVFQPSARTTPGGQRQLRADLQWAVLRGELEVRYQPIVSLADGRIAGAEALVRWQHPTLGLLGPASFIGMAEETGLIADVFEVVLRDACTQAYHWQELLAPDDAIPVSVNLSASQLYQPELVEHITRVLSDTGLPPHLLTLEITETVLIADGAHAQATEALATLKELGVRVAIDDFGTGYSSLAYLRRLPIDVLKMDKLFLQNIGTRDNTALARTIIDLGRNLGMPTVAEGVERVEQRDTIRALGCTHAQGHLFSRPVPADRMVAMLTTQRLQTA